MSNPQVINGVALGSSITVATTAELSALSPTGLTLGTHAYITGTTDPWTLKASTAATSSTVLAVSGVIGWRWIKDAAGTGTVTSLINGVGTVADNSTAATPAVNIAPGTWVDSGASAVQDWDIATGLTGDGDYDINGNFACPDPGGGTFFYLFAPNTLTTNQTSEIDKTGDATPGAVGPSANLYLADHSTNATTATIYFHIKLFAAKSDGTVRMYETTALRVTSDGHNYKYSAAGVWTAGAAITGIRIHAATAASIGAHAAARWRKVSGF